MRPSHEKLSVISLRIDVALLGNVKCDIRSETSESESESITLSSSGRTVVSVFDEIRSCNEIGRLF